MRVRAHCPAFVSLNKWLFWRPPCVLRAVIVNLRSEGDLAIRGVLWGYRGAWLTLRDAALLRANAQATPVDGEVVVHRDNVAFLQVLP